MYGLALKNIIQLLYLHINDVQSNRSGILRCLRVDTQCWIPLGRRMHSSTTRKKFAWLRACTRQCASRIMKEHRLQDATRRGRDRTRCKRPLHHLSCGNRRTRIEIAPNATCPIRVTVCAATVSRISCSACARHVGVGRVRKTCVQEYEYRISSFRRKLTRKRTNCITVRYYRAR